MNLWDIITGAPWWVYVLFIVLVRLGMKATKGMTVSIYRPILLPVVFVAWSLYSLYSHLALGLWSLLPLWIVSLAFGAYLGFLEVRSWHIKGDRHKQQVTLPPNYSTVVLIVLIFILKFFWGYFYATRPEAPYWIYFGDTLTSTLVSGFFVGRAIVFVKRYFKS